MDCLVFSFLSLLQEVRQAFSEDVRHNFFSNVSNHTIEQGYEADHPQIKLLRLRNYTIGKRLTDKEMVGPGTLNKISELIGILEPFVSFSFLSALPKPEYILSLPYKKQLHSYEYTCNSWRTPNPMFATSTMPVRAFEEFVI